MQAISENRNLYLWNKNQTRFHYPQTALFCPKLRPRFHKYPVEQSSLQQSRVLKEGFTNIGFI